MTQDRAQALKGKCVYVDRTVYCRRDQQEERKQFRAKIIELGGQLVGEVDEADVIFVHLATTTLDRTLAGVRDKILISEYAEHCHDENKILPVQRYKVNIEASPEPPASTRVRRRAREQSPPPPPARQRQHRARAGGANFPIASPAPVPGIRVPDTSPFSEAPVCEWACNFVGWYAMYASYSTESQCLRAASACMAKIARPLLPSTFRNFYVKNLLFLDSLRKIVRKSRAEAERNAISGLDESSLDRLLSDAAKAYAAGIERLPGLSVAAPDPIAAPSSAPPRAPQSVFKVGGRRKKSVTAEGEAYLQHLLRHVLVRGGSRSWLAIEQAMPKASNGLVSLAAFRKYRMNEGNAACAKIRAEFDEDRDTVKNKYSGAGEASSVGQQTPRKRRRSLTQDSAGRTTRMRKDTPQYVRPGSSAHAALQLSSDDDEDWTRAY